MSKFESSDLLRIMNNADAVRSFSVIAHVDHGKSTLTDALVQKAGFISEKDAGKKRFTDGKKEEIERGITIKSTGVTMYFTFNEETKKLYNITDEQPSEYLINLVDSPGHVDFSSEVTAALRVTDGALVVVDCVEGVSVQTETVLMQALNERVKPVLIVNKIDRLFFELKLNQEEIYQNFKRVIENTNKVIGIYQDPIMGDLSCDPNKGMVAFGSGFQQWGFTLDIFANIYSKKFNISISKMMERLWGDWYLDSETKKWTQSELSASGKKLKRGFCQFIIEPIQMLYNAVMNDKKAEYTTLLSKLEIKLTREELDKNGKELFSFIMRRWIPLSDTLLGMIVTHLPSPKVAQKYRAEILYNGDIDDECGQAIKNCDPNGPVMLYVSKMVPTTDNSRFYSFGRIFSGTVRAGMKINILGPDYTATQGRRIKNVTIQSTSVMMGSKMQTMDEVPCGNTVCLSGIDENLVKTGTITTSLVGDRFKDMSLSVSPVVRVSIEPENPGDLPKVIEGLKRLSKSDPCVEVKYTEDGELIVAGAGELHVEICIGDLRDFCKVPIRVGKPIVPYRETVIGVSSITCLSKSPNKHNRLYMKAQPLNTDLLNDIESKKLNVAIEDKNFCKTLSDNYGWDPDHSKKIWTYGPEMNANNFLVDCTKGLQYMSEIKESVKAGFAWASKEGVLTGEELRGVRFDIHDVVLHADAIHRGGGQIIPTTRNVVYASLLTAQPRLMEPYYLVDIIVSEDAKGGVYNVMNKRRGEIIDEENKEGTPLYKLKGYLPVAESFGFTASLREATSGKAFPQCKFSHWAIIEEDPLDPSTKVHQIVKTIRKRKGLKDKLPELSDYLDTL